MKSKRSQTPFKKIRKQNVIQKQINSDIVFNFQTYENMGNNILSDFTKTMTYSKIPVISSHSPCLLNKHKLNQNTNKKREFTGISKYKTIISKNGEHVKNENQTSMRNKRPQTAIVKSSLITCPRIHNKKITINKKILIPKKIEFKNKFVYSTSYLNQNSKISKNKTQKFFNPIITQIKGEIIDQRRKVIISHNNDIHKDNANHDLERTNQLSQDYFIKNPNLISIDVNTPTISKEDILNKNSSSKSKNQFISNNKNYLNFEFSRVRNEIKSQNNFYEYVKHLLKYSTYNDGKFGLIMLKEKLDSIEKKLHN